MIVGDIISPRPLSPDARPPGFEVLMMRRGEEKLHLSFLWIFILFKRPKSEILRAESQAASPWLRPLSLGCRDFQRLIA